MNLIGRDIHIVLQDRVDFHCFQTKGGRDASKIEAAETGDIDLKPGGLVVASTRGVCGDKGLPSGLETGGQVGSKGQRTTGVFQSCNITLLP